MTLFFYWAKIMGLGLGASNIVAELVLVYGFYGGRRANRHKNGGIDRAVIGFDLGGTGAGVGVGMEKVEGQGRKRE